MAATWAARAAWWSWLVSPFPPFAFRGGFPPRPRPAARLFEFGGELEPPECVVPHPLERGGHRAERLPSRAVIAEAAVGARAQETRVRQRLELQRHGAEGDVRHRAPDCARALLLVPDEAQDLLTSR